MNTSKLHLLIDSKNLSKVKLSMMTGISDVTISNILKGADAKISSIEAIASALGVPVGYFFDIISQNGDHSVMVGRDNNGIIGDLRDCEKELEHTKALLAEKELMLAEKERLITVLMDKSK